MNSSPKRAADPADRTILVPLDGSPFADGALPTGRALARRFNATVHIVTVAASSGDLQRIRLYAGRGFQIHQEIPDDVWRAYEDLVEAGYDQYLVKD